MIKKERKEIRDPSAEKTQVDVARDFIAARQQAYLQTFSNDQNLFAKKVLADLARFCRANESAFHPDQRVHAVLEGRREVWLRIRQHLDLTPDECEKYFVQQPKGEN